MGKRELIIVAAFALAGLVAFQFAASSAGAPRRFSLRTLMADLRRADPGNRASTSVTQRGLITAPATLEELRLSNAPHVLVSGETRDDIAYELRVDATASTTEAAREAAEGTMLAHDDLGRVLALRIVASVQRDGRQTPHLTLHVPSRLVVRMEGAPRAVSLDARHLAGLELDGVVGDVRLDDITGSVNGSQRNGDLTIKGALSVRLTLTDSNATLSEVSGAIVLMTRNGHCRIDGAGGPVDLELTGTEIEILAPAQTVDIAGSAGRVLVDEPRQPITLDVRNTALDLRLRSLVNVTAFTTASPLRVSVPPDASFTLDAVAVNGGTIEAEGLADATAAGGGASLQRVVGNGGVRVALRNDRGTIVISQRK